MSYSTLSFISSLKEVPAYDKNLSICLSANGFSFSITSTKNELLTLAEIGFEGQPSMADAIMMVKQVFADKNIVLLGFHKAQLVINADYYTWIPESLYQTGNDRQYLTAVCDIPKVHAVFSEFNEHIQAYVVFAADNTLVSAFKIAIPGLKIRCQQSVFVNEENVQRNDMRNMLLVQVRNGKSDFSVLCNRKLLLSNTYSCENFDETIYHTVNLSRQLHLGDTMLDVKVCGQIDRDGFFKMSQFFKDIELYKGNKLSFGNPEMYKIHTYRFANILA